MPNPDPEDREVDARAAADKITDAADVAEGKVGEAAQTAEERLVDDARSAAAALTSEVQILRQDITILQKIDAFKSKIYVIGVVAVIFEIVAFIGLWRVSNKMEIDTKAIRTDLEVHRIRNEASHDCLAEKLTKLPAPEERVVGETELTRQFLHEFLGCVTKTAPSIVPPNAPDIRGERIP